MENLIGTGYFKSCKGVPERSKSHEADFEMEDGPVPVDFHRSVYRSVRVDARDPIVFCQGHICESFACFRFFCRVDAVIVSDIESNGHTAVRNGLQAMHLDFTDKRSLDVFRPCIVERGYLDIVERHFVISPFFPHHFHIRRQESAVLIRPSSVRFTLIPQKSFQSIWNDRRDHRVEQSARHEGIEICAWRVQE